MKDNIDALKKRIRRQAESHPLGNVWHLKPPRYRYADFADAVEQCVRMGNSRYVCEAVIEKSLIDYGLLPHVSRRRPDEDS